jgi:hypothetical protein
MIKLFEEFKSYKKGLSITYSGVILDEQSRMKLLSAFIYPNPNFTDWVKIAHHMTICMGDLPEHLKKYWLDEEVTLTATELGISDKAVAVKVTGLFIISKPSTPEDEGPKFQHITLAINPIDGKPADSNLITDWKEIESMELFGVIKEVEF